MNKPFGDLTDLIKDGFNKQLQEAFAKAMKINATPKQPIQKIDPKVEARKLVAAQSNGSHTAKKPVQR